MSWPLLKPLAMRLRQYPKAQAIVERMDAACDTSCDCIRINSSIRLLLLEPGLADPLAPFPLDPSPEDPAFGAPAGVVKLTEVPSAYEMVVVVDPSEFVAVWVVAPVISVASSNVVTLPCWAPCVESTLSVSLWW